MGACFGVGGMSTGNMRLMSGSMGNVLRMADLFASRSHHISYVFTQVLNAQPVLAELVFRKNE